MSLLNLNGTYDDETCLSRLSISAETNESIVAGHRCGVVWDSFLCWGPAFPGSTVYSPCPAAKGMDVTKQAFRRCDSSGSWLNQKGLPDERGWTNYTPCFTPEILSLLKRLYTGSEDEAMSKIEIARRTRILEIVGLSLSLTALVLSLFIFYYFRSLRNPRTRLHRHLFIAMVIQVAVRLTLYIDQFVVRSYSDMNEAQQEGQNARGIDNTPILCEAAYICLEYARTAMFMWMFVEGLYLHNMITVTVFEEKLSPSIYPLVGWVFPMPLTLSWAIVTAKHYGAATCWWGYNFTVYFWILEGPRLGVLMVNLAFLLNILRVLVTKLRQSNSSEAHQARKAVKAALVLLPLLGLTNLVNMLEAPLERSAVEFGLWAYTAHALNSCQGLILACLYCFWNGEVQLALKKFMRYKIFNGAKYRGGGKPNGRAGSLRMSLMNNSGGRNQGIVVAAGGRQTPLQENNQQRNDSGAGQGSISPPSQPIRLSKVLQATNDIHVEIEPTKSSCDDSSSTSSPIHSGPKSQKSSKYSHTTSSCTLGSAHESAGNKFKRFSKLRIWISPLMFASNEADRKSRSSYNNEPTNLSVPEIRIKDEDEEENGLGGEEKDDDDDEGIAEEVEEPEGEDLEVVVGREQTLCSTEGCHFRIEVEEDVEEVK